MEGFWVGGRLGLDFNDVGLRALGGFNPVIPFRLMVMNKIKARRSKALAKLAVKKARNSWKRCHLDE